MSLARTALRLQAIEALNADPVVGPACEGRIFDSRLAELSHVEPVPVIVVTTEETKGDAWSANNGGAPFDTSCDLVLEIAMDAVAEDDEGNVGTFIPATDRELEAVLDGLEEASIEALTVGMTPAARALREHVIRRVTEFKSARFATDDTGEKLAIRLVTLRVQIKGDEPDVLNPPTGAFATLPNPLRAVCELFPAGSSACDACGRLAAMRAGEGVAPFLGLDARVSPSTHRPAGSAPTGTPGAPTAPSQPDFGVTATLDP